MSRLARADPIKSCKILMKVVLGCLFSGVRCGETICGVFVRGHPESFMRLVTGTMRICNDTDDQVVIV